MSILVKRLIGVITTSTRPPKGGRVRPYVEAELVKPIPEIRLEAQHMTIDYAPVAFTGG
jgi:hypothetical protein